MTKSGEFQPRYHPGCKTSLSRSQAFEIAVGAILTQNTAWSNVEKALTELHRRRRMNPSKIATVRSSQLAIFIRSSGYFTQKAKKLKILARFVQFQAHGNLLRLAERPTDVLREQLLGLWGVGPETADSILLYALGKPVFVVDGYTRRIGERLGWPFQKKGYEEIRAFFETNLASSAAVFQEFHALLVRLAKERCFKRAPDCPGCPLRARCAFGA